MLILTVRGGNVSFNLPGGGASWQTAGRELVARAGQGVAVTVNTQRLAGAVAGAPGLVVLLAQDNGGSSTGGSDWPPDLRDVDKDLKKWAKKHPITSGQCHKCAEGMLNAVKKLARYQVDIVKVWTPSARRWMGTLDNRTVSLNGWHKFVRFSKEGEEPLFLDAEIYNQRGGPVSWNELTKFYQDADLWYVENP